MKESELIKMQKEVAELKALSAGILEELMMVKDLSIGTLELFKRTDVYKPALDKMSEEYTQSLIEKNKANEGEQ